MTSHVTYAVSRHIIRFYFSEIDTDLLYGAVSPLCTASIYQIKHQTMNANTDPANNESIVKDPVNIENSGIVNNPDHKGRGLSVNSRSTTKQWRR